MDNPFPLCKDCKYARISWWGAITDNWDKAICTHPNANKNKDATPDFVAGKIDPPEYVGCSGFRMSQSSKCCGPAGQFFFPRNKIEQVEWKLDRKGL